EHTVARGHLNLDTHMFEGRVDGEYVTETPMPITLALLDRGQQRFNIYCTPCHDRVGTGHGMVVQRGFTKPPSFHDIKVREKPVGYYFEVMTKGFGRMSDYAAQIKPADRWAIAAYIRALQLSQSAKLDELPTEDQALIAAGSADTHDVHGHDDGHEDDGHSENH
ncbi:MAG: cytochrome c, partial [Kiritimatiellae bacterium]|nr:cytochrome c [Kiritimatiellia bacterium]